MKSDIIHITNNGNGTALALEQAELTASYKKLSAKNTIRLRLLAEELIGMFTALTGEVEGDFWIEDRENEFELHLLTETNMTEEKRSNLLSVSTTGENVSAKGFMGKIRDILERALEPINDATPRYFGGGWYSSSFGGVNAMSMGSLESEYWSLNQYRDSLPEDGNGEDWDELEKSVVSKLADEVRIGIDGRRAEIIIFKKFE